MTTDRATWFVSTDWLAARLGKPEIVVVDASWYLPTDNRNPEAEYLAGHIPGAVRFDIDAIADTSSGLPHMLPTADAFAKAMATLGISDHHTIVVYDGAGLFSAPRVWWTFKVFGARDVRILDGGLPAWTAEGRPVEAGMVTRAPASFAAKLNSDMVRALGEVDAALTSGSAQIVDARPAPRFQGKAAEPRAGVRSGRMPGAKNVPAGTLIEAGRLAAPEKLATHFASAGVETGQPIITSCGSGVTAAILWLALETIGQPPELLALYDGSWTEWGGHPGTRVVTD